jgi:predicted O-methyltransferase YrrM
MGARDCPMETMGTEEGRGMAIDERELGAVKGFLDPKEGRCLLAAAREASRLGPCLEIGSYCGKSTIYLATGCKENGAVLFSVDHHRGSEEQQPGQEYFDPDLLDPRTGAIDTFRFFRDALKRFELEDTVVPIVCRSAVAARSWATPLSLVFIDGGHSLESAYRDYNAWAGHIVPGGFLVIHDLFPDASKGGQAPYRVYRLALASGLFSEVTVVQTLGILRRREVGSLPDHAALE